MKITHVHGMCESSYNRFMNNEGKQSGPWTVSDRDNLTYLYSVKKAMVEYDDDNECALNIIQDDAIWSSILQCALNGEQFLYVLFCNVNPDIVSDDFSCENMAHISDCILSAKLKESVVYVKKYRWNNYFAPFVIAEMMRMDHFNIENININILQVIENIENIGNIEIFIEDIVSYCEFQEEINFIDLS